MATKFLNISTDNTLGGNSPSDEIVSSQKAVKGYVDSHTGGNAVWGNITGILSNQTDLKNELDSCVHLADTETITGLKTFKQSSSRISYMINSTINLATTPSSNMHAFIDFIDSQTTPARIGVMGALQITDGWYGTYMQAGNIGSISIQTDGTNIRTSAPTPANANDNSTKIATTAWVTNHEYSYATNCITEIPQDIKLELSNGTLTLKAGSKVYVPNGSGVFDTITTTADITVSGASTSPNAVRYLFYNNGSIYVFVNGQSGTTPPSSGTNVMFYNTSDNTIKRYTNGSVVASGYSFPLALIKDDGTYLCGAIDQVFNGFGYIGSTVFVLPYFKALVPSGRNWDGTLYNTEVEITSVQTYGRNLTQKSVPLWIKYDRTFTFSTGITYDPVTNLSNNDKLGIIATADLTGGVISNWKPKTAFHAVDYNDTNADFVVASQLPTSANNYTWYRKYKSGWVEQGGTYSWSGNGSKGPINLPIAMSNTHYQIMMTTVGTDVDGSDTTTIYSRTTTSFNVGAYASSREMVWQVSGIAA